MKETTTIRIKSVILLMTLLLFSCIAMSLDYAAVKSFITESSKNSIDTQYQFYQSYFLLWSGLVLIFITKTINVTKTRYTTILWHIIAMFFYIMFTYQYQGFGFDLIFWIFNGLVFYQCRKEKKSITISILIILSLSLSSYSYANYDVKKEFEACSITTNNDEIKQCIMKYSSYREGERRFISFANIKLSKINIKYRESLNNFIALKNNDTDCKLDQYDNAGYKKDGTMCQP